MSTNNVNNNSSNNKLMWRSKLGYDYCHDFMVQNEAELLKKLYKVRDETPENRICADCGTRGTVWASVNLGVFLCMMCGAHHRSLGTHISKPKGCTGTYWWGPDEIEQMQSIGNARAQALYGPSQPPAGLTNSDSARWKEYLVNKYVHKKFASHPAQHSAGGGGLFSNAAGSSNNNNSALLPARTNLPTHKFPSSWAAQAKVFPNNRVEEDLISFQDDFKGFSSKVLSRASSSSVGAGAKASLLSTSQCTIPVDNTVIAAGNNDFFAQFGL